MQYIGALQKTTLVDFPPFVSAAVFLHGCNLRCPYCYNPALVTGNSGANADYDAVAVADVIGHLEKRKNVLRGLVISGGEALLQKDAVHELIYAARALGYKIKLDTNGILPERLEELIEETPLTPDFIALDVKTSPVKYARFLASQNAQDDSENAHPGLAFTMAEKIIKSIKLLSRLPKEMREFRTVLVPPLVTQDDILKIAALLPHDASWRFARFKNLTCLDQRYTAIEPYTESEIEALIKTASEIIPDAVLR